MDLHALGTQPIDPESPAGADVRYEPAFEELQAEIDKLSLPSAAGEAIDWRKVSDLAAAILAGQAKDLLVAGYLGVALVHLRQYRGLGEALVLMADLLENFWDTLFPPRKRMRGRLAAIEWWLEKSETALAMLPPASLGGEDKAALYGACERLEQLLADLFPEPPGLRGITRILDDVAVAEDAATGPEPAPAGPSAEETAATAPRPEPAAAPSPAAAATRPPAAEPPADAAGAEKAVQDSLQAISRALPLLRMDNPARPLAYRLLRVALWSPVEALPPDTDGRTLIPPPDPQAASMLQDLFRRGDWSGLVEAAESRLAQYIFWLDLNRYSAMALERLGPPYSGAGEAVCSETAALLQRLAGLENLAFADGTPLAGPDTRQWLQTIAPGGGGEAVLGAAESGAPEAGDTRFTEVFDQAKTLVAEKKLVRGVALLQEEMQRSFSGRDRLRWRLALVRILVASKNVALALPHFDELVSEIDTYRLESWDPGLALTCFKVIRAGLRSMPDEAARERADAMLRRIARLDPVEALRQER